MPADATSWTRCVLSQSLCLCGKIRGLECSVKTPTDWIGVDFGTTNSAVAFVDAVGSPKLVQFPSAHGPRPTFPSVLYFEPKKPSVAGADAIEHYLAAESRGRFIQSL